MDVDDFPEGVRDHQRLQRWLWCVQRIAWIGFAAILVMCLFGLFGRGGMLAERTVTVEGGRMNLPAISRWNAPETITVTFNPSEGLRTLVVDDRFYRIFSLDTIDPRPMATVAMTGRTGYDFPADPNAELAVVLRLQTQRPWLQEFDIGIGDDVVNRSVFVFP